MLVLEARWCSLLGWSTTRCTWRLLKAAVVMCTGICSCLLQAQIDLQLKPPHCH